MMIKRDSDQVIALAKAWRQKDKRLSWETCLKKARQEARLFGGRGERE
ncbi:hypothetical protein QTO01_11400 [Vibrio mytili]